MMRFEYKEPVMRYTFDFKSILVGAILAAGLFLAFGAAHRPAPQPRRFRIEASDRYVYVLDSTTGQVWEKSLGSRNEQFAKPKL